MSTAGPRGTVSGWGESTSEAGGSVRAALPSVPDLRCLRHLQELKIQRVTSQGMARRYHLSATQIRKDLAQFSELGIRGVGYAVDELADHLNALLGLDRPHAMLIVGMGNLGSALAQYLGFNYGAFHVVAGLDNDPQKIVRKVGSLVVRSVADLAEVMRESGAEIVEELAFFLRE